MKTATTKSLIDSVHAGEISIDAITDPGGGIALTAKLALVNAKGGYRLGFMNKRNWSEHTWKKLREFLDALEADALVEVFGEDATGSGEAPVLPPGDGVPGL